MGRHHAILRFAFSRSLLGLLVCVVLAAGCSGDDSSDDGEPASTEPAEVTPADTEPEQEVPKAGGTLTMAVFATPTGLDPVVAAGGGATSGTEMAAIYDTLIRWDPATAGFEPRLALAVEPNADGSQWVIRLRPDVVFSDGTPFDANAVKLALDRHRSPRNLTSSAAYMTRVADVAVADALTVVVTLTEPWPGFATVLADEAGMIPSPTALAACGDAEPAACGYNTAPVGAGPFVVESFVPGEELVLRRSDTYWGAAAHLDQVRFLSFRDSGGERTRTGLDEGEVDVAFLRAPGAVLTARAAGRPGHSVIVSGGSVTLMNTGAWITCTGGEPAVHCAGREDGQFRTTPPTSVVEVRRAIAAALEPNAIDRAVNDGAGRAGSALLPVAFTNEPPVPGPAHDVATAKALADQVKAVHGWNGQVRYRCTNTPTNVARAEVMRTQLAAAGIELVVDVSGGTEAQVQAVTSRDFDLACWGLQVTPDELGADSLRQNLLSTLGTNRSGYESAEMDAALTAMRLAPDQAAKQAAFRQVAELYARDLPFYVDAAIEEYVTWGEHVRGIDPGLGSVVHFDEAWLAD